MVFLTIKKQINADTALRPYKLCIHNVLVGGDWVLSKIHRPLLTIIFSILLIGCSTYHRKPLNHDEINEILNTPSAISDQNHSECDLACDVEEILKRRLNDREIKELAVLISPDLKALRAKEKVACAQVFDAGLLPDPQMAITYAHPPGMMPGTTDAYSFGLNYDIGALATVWLNKKIACEKANQTRYDVAWQEWLTANQAQLLAIKIYYLQQQLGVAQRASKSAKDLVDLTKIELEKHDTTIDVFGLRQATYLDFVGRAISLDRTLKKTILELNALLGLPPEKKLFLKVKDSMKIRSLNPDEIFKAAQGCRLDLLALRAGYDSQEAKVLQTILGQFPHFSMGINRSKDDTGIITNGISLNFDLPIFNRNRGAIAIAETTREQLYLEYIARLNQTRSDIASLVTDLKLVVKEVAVLDKELPKMREAQKLMWVGVEKGNITLITYSSFLTDFVTNELKLLSLKQNKAELQIALQIAQGRDEGC